MQDVWLEVRSCQESAERELDRETVLRVPALSEVMQMAENTMTDMQRKGGGQMWDYSRKLQPKEVAEVMKVFANAVKRDDVRATSHTLDVTYNEKCYTLTLFAYKSE